MEVLGHKFFNQGLIPQESKVRVIANWAASQDVHELRSFFGAVGYYRNFIDKFSQKLLLHSANCYKKVLRINEIRNNREVLKSFKRK